MKRKNRIKDKLKKLATAGLLAGLTISSTAHAAIADSKIASGLTNLLNDASTWLMGLAPVAGIVFVAYFFIRKTGADEQDQKKWADRIKMAIICSVGALVAGVIINTLSGYFS